MLELDHESCSETQKMVNGLLETGKINIEVVAVARNRDSELLMYRQKIAEDGIIHPETFDFPTEGADVNACSVPWLAQRALLSAGVARHAQLEIRGLGQPILSQSGTRASVPMLIGCSTRLALSPLHAQHIPEGFVSQWLTPRAALEAVEKQGDKPYGFRNAMCLARLAVLKD